VFNLSIGLTRQLGMGKRDKKKDEAEETPQPAVQEPLAPDAPAPEDLPAE
jgi:hypothetical protein